MNISAISNYNKQSFGVQLDHSVTGKVKTARFHAYSKPINRHSEQTLKNIEELERIKNDYVLYSYINEDKHTGKNKYDYYMVPTGCCRSCSEYLCSIPAEDTPMLVVAKLLHNVKNYKDTRKIKERYW